MPEPTITPNPKKPRTIEKLINSLLATHEHVKADRKKHGITVRTTLWHEAAMTLAVCDRLLDEAAFAGGVMAKRIEELEAKIAPYMDQRSIHPTATEAEAALAAHSAGLGIPRAKRADGVPMKLDPPEAEEPPA